MTWGALFTSWQFWLVIFLNTSFSTVAGMALVALMQANGRDEDETLAPSDLSLELLNLREEGKRLQDEANCLRMVNEDLQKQIDALDPGYADYGTEHGISETADGRRT